MHVTSGTSFVIDSGETNSGNTQIQGNLTVNGTKSFRITHPLDPSMWLLHASIESDEVMNLYRGRVITDANSNAIVTLPNWFAAENAPPYQFSLAVVGSFAQATIAVEPGGTLGGNAFAIQTSAPNTTVSWSLSGVRNDDAVRTNRMVVELKKTAL